MVAIRHETPVRITIHDIGADAPRLWLRRAYADMRAMPRESFTYGAMITGMSWFITGGLYFMGMAAWIPAFAAGFVIVAPLFAIGLYRICRVRLSEPSMPVTKMVDNGDEPTIQLFYFGFVLAFILLC